MKKIKVNNAFTPLGKEEMKSIQGGYENYCCLVVCPGNPNGTYYGKVCSRVTAAPSCVKNDVQCSPA